MIGKTRPEAFHMPSHVHPYRLYVETQLEDGVYKVCTWDIVIGKNMLLKNMGTSILPNVLL